MKKNRDAKSTRQSAIGTFGKREIDSEKVIDDLEQPRILDRFVQHDDGADLHCPLFGHLVGSPGHDNDRYRFAPF